MGFLGKSWLAEAADWVALARTRDENPFFEFLTVVSKRRSATRKWYQRAAPLIIGALPALIWIAVVVYEYLIYGYTNSLDSVVLYSPLVFIGVSYIVWASIELNQTIMDAMSLLRRSTKQTSRYELDDLTCVTSITDREIVAGFMGHVLPPLFLRIVAGVGYTWVVFLLGMSDWFANFSQDHLIMVALSPISIGVWSLSGCLGVTGLITFFLSLGSGQSTIPASMGSLVVLGSQGIWLSVNSGLMYLIQEDPFGGTLNPWEGLASHGAVLLAPLVFVTLIAWGMKAAARYPAIKPIQAIGSPLLIPCLAVIALMIGFYYLQPHYMESLSLCLISFVWHFGDLLPLNFASLLSPVFTSGDIMSSGSQPLNLWYRPITILLTQLALVSICLKHAVKAVGQRRQAR